MEHMIETFLNGGGFRKLFDKEFEAVRKKYQLCRIDLQILTYLDQAGEQNTSKNIVDMGFYTKGHVSQSLTRLHKMGLVTMEQDQQDRRQIHLFLTEEARGIVAEVLRVRQQINEIVFRNVTEEESQMLAQIAAKIIENIQQETGI